MAIPKKIKTTDTVQVADVVQSNSRPIIVNFKEQAQQRKANYETLQRYNKRYPWAKGWTLENFINFERNATQVYVNGTLRTPITYKPRTATISQDNRTEAQHKVSQQRAKQEAQKQKQLKETQQTVEIINDPYNPIGWVPGVRTMVNAGADQVYSRNTGQAYTPYTTGAAMSAGFDAFGVGSLKNLAGAYIGSTAGGIIGDKYGHQELGQFIGGLTGGFTGTQLANAVRKGASTVAFNFSPNKTNIRFIRNMKGVPEVDENGMFMLSPERNALTNFTWDKSFRTHKRYKHRPGGEYLVINPESLKGERFLSTDPMDSFIPNRQLRASDVILISGNPETRALAKSRGFKVATSPKIDEIYAANIASYKPAYTSGILAKADKGPFASSGAVIYDDAVNEFVHTTYGKPNIIDALKLRWQTGINPHIRFNPSLKYHPTTPIEFNLGKRFGFNSHPTTEVLSRERIEQILDELGAKPYRSKISSVGYKSKVNRLARIMNDNMVNPKDLEWKKVKLPQNKRYKWGDAEFDNPNLLYHIDQGDFKGWNKNKVKGAYIKDGKLYPGDQSRPDEPAYSWWNKGNPYTMGDAWNRLIIATDNPQFLHVRSQPYRIGQWDPSKKKSLVTNSEYVTSKPVQVTSKQIFHFDKNYGWKRSDLRHNYGQWVINIYRQGGGIEDAAKGRFLFRKSQMVKDAEKLNGKRDMRKKLVKSDVVTNKKKRIQKGQQGLKFASYKALETPVYKPQEVDPFSEYNFPSTYKQYLTPKEETSDIKQPSQETKQPMQVQEQKIQKQNPKSEITRITNHIYKDRNKWVTDLKEAYKRAGITNSNALKMLIAQDALESGWGKSAQGKFNYGNLTPGKSWKGAVVNGRDTDGKGNPISQKFRSYNSIDEYAADKVQFLKTLYDFNENDNISTFTHKLQGGNKGKRRYAAGNNYIQLITKIYNTSKL